MIMATSHETCSKRMYGVLCPPDNYRTRVSQGPSQTGGTLIVDRGNLDPLLRAYFIWFLVISWKI